MSYLTRQLPGTDPDKWRQRSRAGECCGIVGCINPPRRRCKPCDRYYCDAHAEPHAKGGHGTVSVLEGENP